MTAGATVGSESEKRTRSHSLAGSVPASAEAVGQAHYGRHGVQVHAGGPIGPVTVKSRSGTAGLTLGVLVIVATLVGMMAGAWLAPQSKRAADAAPADGDFVAPAWQVSMPNRCGASWVIPDTGQSSIPISDGPPAGAALGSGGIIYVTFQGLGDEAAVLQSVSVEVVRRSAPLRGVYVRGRCGSNITPHFYKTDLDDPQPQVIPMPGEDAGQTVPAQEFSFKVGKSDVEKAVIVPSTSHGYVEWYLHVKWTSGDRQGDLRIGDGTKPFKSTATAAAKRWCVDYGSDELAWVDLPDGAPCE